MIVPHDLPAGLTPGLVYIQYQLEDPRTYECWPSYETIGKAIGKSKSSVKRYVAGLKKNGNLRYHM